MSTVIIIVVSVIFLFILLTVYNYRRIKNMPTEPENSKIRHLTANNFNQSIKNGISVVDFWAEWCMPCKLMMPIMNDLANYNHIKVFKVNVDEQQSLASKFSIKSIPSILIFKNGNEVKRIIGVKTKDFILKEIEKLK
jgi:thioredoxin 1